MNETLATLLSIGMGILILLSVFTIAVLIILLYLYYRIRRHTKRFIHALNQVKTSPTPFLEFDGQYFTPDESRELKAVLRERKGQEARDSATLDTATEFHRDN